MLQEQIQTYPINISFFDVGRINSIVNVKCNDISINNTFETYLDTTSSSSIRSYQENQDNDSSISPKSFTNTRSRWTKDEEKKLINLVSVTGARGWNQIASLIKTKTAKQCRDHYANCLNPEIKNSLWTDEEEQILLSKYQEYGSHWSKIKKFLPGRTTAMIKNYVTMLLKKNERKVNDQYQQSLNIHIQNEQNEDSSSYSCCNPSSDADEQNFSLDMSNVQNNYTNFNYHDISSILI